MATTGVFLSSVSPSRLGIINRNSNCRVFRHRRFLNFRAIIFVDGSHDPVFTNHGRERIVKERERYNV